MKKFKNICLIFILIFSCTVFCACDFDLFNFEYSVIDETQDSTKYIEIVANSVISSNEEVIEE